MKKDGIHLPETALQDLAAKLHAIPAANPRRPAMRRLWVGTLSGAAAALALALFWGRLSFSSNENAAAPGEWLEQTPTSDVVESLESDVWSTDAQELGALLTDEELSDLNPVKSSKS